MRTLFFILTLTMLLPACRKMVEESAESEAEDLSMRFYSALTELDYEKARKLVAEGFDVNAKGMHGYTYLHQAVDTNCTEWIGFLVRLGRRVGQHVGLSGRAAQPGLIEDGLQLPRPGDVIPVAVGQEDTADAHTVASDVLDEGRQARAGVHDGAITAAEKDIGVGVQGREDEPLDLQIHCFSTMVTVSSSS